MKTILIVAAMMAVMGAAQAAELYRWVDKQGVVHYGDFPMTEDAEQVKIAVPSEEAASGVGADIPYEARLAAQHFPVTLYVFVGCDEGCKQAQAYLKKRRVPYTETVIKTQEEFDAFRQRTGIDGLPALSVGRKWLRGFQAGAWDEELDAAGFPK
jgi:glutaredoxin